MKKVILLLLLCFSVCSCASKESFKELDYKQIMEQRDYVILDVRTEEEYDASHIKNAINIPYDKIAEAKLDHSKAIFVYCQSGNRSKIAYNKLKELDFEVYDLGAFEKIDLPKE